MSEMRWKSGLTWRVVLAILYGAIVLMPVRIWGELMIGTVGNLTWTVVILFYWLSLIYGSPLTKQEILVMLAATGTAIYAGTGLSFHSMFYRIWFTNSPIIKLYGIEKFLPYWWIPENELIRTQVLRTFVHPSWVPIITYSLVFWILNLVIGLTLGFFFYHLFVEVERLPFPLARVHVEVLTELEEREPLRMRLFVLFALLGFIYSFIAYGIPTISQALVGRAVILIPYPWYDMTESFRESLPGAMIGIDTNLMSYLMGLILPYEVVVCTFIGSFISSVIGNPLVVWYYPELLPKEIVGFKGLKLEDIMFWSNLYIWIMVSIGMGFAVFVDQLVSGRKGLIRAIKALTKLSKEARKLGYLPLHVIFGVYLTATITWLLLLEFAIIPGFPLLPIFLLIVVWPFMFGLISIRTYAETGYFLEVPHLNALVLIQTMEIYKIPVYSKLGIWPWFAPLGVDYGGGWVGTLFVCRGVKCTFSSYMKAVFLVATPIAIILNLLYSEYLWKMTPIPSPMFRHAQIYWPIRAARSVLWYTRKIFSLNVQLLVGGFVAALVTSSILRALHIPFSLVGILYGISSPLPGPLAIFIGGTLAKLIEILSKGRINLRKYANMMVGGYGVGLAVAMTISVSISIFVKSLWPLPY